MSDVVKIEQRLQDFPVFFILPADEASVIGLSVMLGFLGRQPFVGLIIGILFWFMWKRVKGEGGPLAIAAALYWMLPASISPFRALPDSGVVVWKA